MESEHKEKINDEPTTDHKKYKKKKSVNWESKKLEDNKAPNEPVKNVENGKDSNDKDFIEVEIINKDGSIIKEHVKCESKESKEFVKKREERAHDEYTKAKEFLENHKDEGE